MTDYQVMRSVHTDEGFAQVDRGFWIGACSSDACSQGRERCPFPAACHLSEEDEGPGLLSSPWFWACGLGTALAFIITGVVWQYY